MYYSYGYLFYIPVTLVCIAILLIYGLKKRKSLPYYFLSVLAIIYVNFIVDNMLFPIIIDSNFDYPIYYNISLRVSLGNTAFRHNILNILSTLPIGIGIQFIFDLKRTHRWIIAVILAETPEVVQLILICLIHPVNKIFDINDVILNGIGVLIGLLIISLVNRLIRIPPKDTKTVFRYCWNICYQTDRNMQ